MSSDCVNWWTRLGSLLSCLRVCCMVRKVMALCGSALVGLNRTVIRISTHLIFLALPQLPFSIAVRRVAVALAEAVVHCVDAIAFERAAVWLATCAFALDMGALLMFFAILVAARILSLLCVVDLRV